MDTKILEKKIFFKLEFDGRTLGNIYCRKNTRIKFHNTYVLLQIPLFVTYFKLGQELSRLPIQNHHQINVYKAGKRLSNSAPSSGEKSSWNSLYANVNKSTSRISVYVLLLWLYQISWCPVYQGVNTRKLYLSFTCVLLRLWCHTTWRPMYLAERCTTILPWCQGYHR